MRYYTDPACPWSWANEPAVRRLMVEFGDSLSWTYVMGGLARDYGKGHEDPEAGHGGKQGVYPGLVTHWLDVADEGGMPIDPRLWTEGPIVSTYPACMAVKAASEQGEESVGRYLRVLREGLLCFRRKLDTTEALVEEARQVGLDAERFRIDLGSHAIVEAFGADLEETRGLPAEAAGRSEISDSRERLPFPTASFLAEDGSPRWLFGAQPYEAYRDAAVEAGAAPLQRDRPDVLGALERFGRMAVVELEAVCDLPRPRVAAELWRLALEWRARPVAVLTGELWEAA